MIDFTFGIDERYCLSDDEWERIKPLLPKPKRKKVPGRPRIDDRKAITAILYVLRTGCQWKALPSSLGAGSSIHRRFQQWVEAKVFKKMWKAGLLELGEKKRTGLGMAVYGWSDDEGPVRRRKDRQKPHG
jgi:transposase